MASLSQSNKFVLAVLMIILAGFAGRVVWFMAFKANPPANTNANIANTNIPNNNIATNVNVNGQIDISNWQTYRNEKLGFSILYPSDWQIESKNENDIISCKLGWPRCSWSLTINMTDDGINDFIDKYNKSDLLPNGDALAKIYKQERITLNNHEATKLVGSTALGIDNIFVIINNANKRYVLSYNDVKEESRDVGEKIIQTFSIIP